MKKIGFIILISCICFSADLPNAALKKIDKTLAALWEGQSIKKEELKVGEDLKLIKIKADNKFAGYYVLAKANSKADYFDYMVVYKPDLSILTVQVLVYREDYGGEIGSKRWLRQFIGKTKTDEMKFGHDIQNISGATISERSITSGVQKVTVQINHLKKEGKI
jgi:Na+-translocating ferredoxin:NAD+ oxidoreductase RnfG subunit